MKPCAVSECTAQAYKRGWCNAHYKRWKRHGDPLAGRIPNGEANRYFHEVVLPYEGDECLKWPHATSLAGYGVMSNRRGSAIVSRRVCEHVHGPAPTPKHEAAHSCGNGGIGCVTKRHLSWKTSAENSADCKLHGTQHRGTKTPSVKLDDNKVREIRALHGKKSSAELSRAFGVTRSHIWNIQKRHCWAWLSDGEAL